MTSQSLDSLERAILEVERAGEAYARLAMQEAVLSDSRSIVRHEAVKRLMEPRPVQSKPPKGYTGNAFDPLPPLASSPSAAEKLVHQDEQFRDHLEAEREATLEKNLAYTRLLSTRLRALGLLVEAIARTPNAMTSLLSNEIDLDLIRARHDDVEQTRGGVPR